MQFGFRFQILLFSTSVRFSTKTLAYLAYLAYKAYKAYTENNTWARVDMEFLFELNTRRKIPHLQAIMYYFVYHINTVTLYWEEKPTSLINENK